MAVGWAEEEEEEEEEEEDTGGYPEEGGVLKTPVDPLSFLTAIPW